MSFSESLEEIVAKNRSVTATYYAGKTDPA